MLQDTVASVHAVRSTLVGEACCCMPCRWVGGVWLAQCTMLLPSLELVLCCVLVIQQVHQVVCPNSCCPMSGSIADLGEG